MILSEIANNTQAGLMDDKHFAQVQLSGKSSQQELSCSGCLKNT